MRNSVNNGVKVFTCTILALMAVGAMAGQAYPLKLAPGQHYIVDQNGTPFFIQGDSPWFLTESLNGADVDFYLSNRWVQGYNSIILNITARPTESGQPSDANIYGQRPFTGTMAGPYTNLLTWNVNYFTNVDAVIQRAGHYGMCVFAYPLYDGFGGIGWYSQMAGNPTNTLFLYGQFIGNRYRNFTNIVWVGAGDYDESNAPNNCLWNIVAAGITSVDTNHLITAQASRPNPASDYSGFITLNSTYPSQFTYIESLANYQQSPVLASFDREPYYENKNVTGTPFNDLDCRNFFWWSVTSGDAGCFYGDDNQWPFNAGWQDEMWDAGATTMTNVIKLMNTRPWFDCIPDSDQTTVTSGYGTSGTMDYITCIRQSTGNTVIIYIPRDQMTPTVDLTKVSGTVANAWWYNPQTGAATSIGTFNTSGTQTFTPPDADDWVLVLDDAAQNYGPPGISLPQAPVITENLTNQSANMGGTVSLGVASNGSTPLGFQWYFNGTNLQGAVSNPLILANVKPVNSGSYQVVVTNSVGAAASYVATLTVVNTNVLAIQALPGNLFLITVTGIPGRTYTLQQTTNLTSPWQTLGSATVNSSGTFSFYATGTMIPGFFRSTYP
jgi:Protein of unknown function (DUF4038)/Putative collagen-binding domain of a collagenase/Immunoglobulin I-set domain